MSRKIYIGDVVHYTHSNQRCRTAFISDMQFPGAEVANIQVLFDGPDYPDGNPQRFVWKHKAEHSKTLMEGYWHTIQECPYQREALEQEKKQAPSPFLNSTQKERGNLESHHPSPVASTATSRPNASDAASLTALFDEASSNPSGNSEVLQPRSIQDSGQEQGDDF